jgi:hypothetical protein
MLVSLFRADRPAVLLLLVVLVPLTLLGTWDGPATATPAHMPLYALLHATVGAHPWAIWAVGVLIVGLLCLQITALSNDADLLDQRSNLPALLFPLLLAAMGRGTLLDPALAGMPLVVAAMRRVLRTDLAAHPLRYLFDAGFLLGMAALVHLPYAFLVVVVLSTISVTRPFHWREYVVPVVGTTVAIYLGWSFVALTDVLPWRPFQTVWAQQAPVALPRGQRVALYTVIAMLAMIAVPVYASAYRRSVVRVRNLRAAFLGLMAALGVLVLLLRGLTGQFPAVLAATPLSIFLSHALVGTRMVWARETLVAALLLCALWVQW